MTLRTLVLLLSCLALTACSKVTANNFAKIKTGMTFDEVRSELGKPESCKESKTNQQEISNWVQLKECHWRNDDGHIEVNFAENKVAVFTSENLK